MARAYLKLHKVRKVVVALWARHLRLVHVLPGVFSAEHVVYFLTIQEHRLADLTVDRINVRAGAAEKANACVVFLVLFHLQQVGAAGKPNSHHTTSKMLSATATDTVTVVCVPRGAEAVHQQRRAPAASLTLGQGSDSHLPPHSTASPPSL